MKRTYLIQIILVSLVLYSSVVIGKDPLDEIDEIYNNLYRNPKSLTISSNLQRDENAEKTLKDLAQLIEQMDKYRDEKDIPKFDEIDSLNLKITKDLINLIKKYPNSTTALTVKLWLADIGMTFAHFSVAERLYDEIITTHSDTWQGKLATLSKVGIFYNDQKYKEAVKYINDHKQAIIDLEQTTDKEFLWFKTVVLCPLSHSYTKRYELCDYTMEAYYCGILVHLYCVTGDFENAYREGKYLLNKYPSFAEHHDITELQLEQRIKKGHSPYHPSRQPDKDKGEKPR